jgi:quercetin dioxygenase-like cupin family protein
VLNAAKRARNDELGKVGTEIAKGNETRIKKGAVMKAKATQSFAQHRSTGANPAAGVKAEATQGTFTTSKAISWKPVDPKHPGLMMFVLWGNPNEGASLILQKFPAGMDSGWHTHTAAYQGVVIQGKFTHTFEGAAPQSGGPGSVWSQPAGQVHDDKCEEGGDCIIAVHFQDKLDFMPVNNEGAIGTEDL